MPMPGLQKAFETLKAFNDTTAKGQENAAPAASAAAPEAPVSSEAPAEAPPVSTETPAPAPEAPVSAPAPVAPPMEPVSTEAPVTPPATPTRTPLDFSAQPMAPDTQGLSAGVAQLQSPDTRHRLAMAANQD